MEQTLFCTILPRESLKVDRKLYVKEIKSFISKLSKISTKDLANKAEQIFFFF
jgi:hypothetical protein